MTIAQAFNEITIAQGGTPNDGGTIAGAIDALNDALAGSDQECAQTIEGAVRLLGAHIGGGSSITVEPLNATENKTYTAPEGKAYSPVTVDVDSGFNFGSLQVVTVTEVLPEIGGNSESAFQNVYEISSGETVFARGMGGMNLPIAAGLTAISFSDNAENTECDAYVCGVDGDYLYTSVTPWSGTVTVGSIVVEGATCATYTLTVPELDFYPETFTGEYLVLYVHS